MIGYIAIVAFVLFCFYVAFKFGQALAHPYREDKDDTFTSVRSGHWDDPGTWGRYQTTPTRFPRKIESIIISGPPAEDLDTYAILEHSECFADPDETLTITFEEG